MDGLMIGGLWLLGSAIGVGVSYWGQVSNFKFQIIHCWDFRVLQESFLSFET